MFSANADPDKIIIHLQIGMEIVLFSKSILSLLF